MTAKRPRGLRVCSHSGEPKYNMASLFELQKTDVKKTKKAQKKEFETEKFLL